MPRTPAFSSPRQAHNVHSPLGVLNAKCQIILDQSLANFVKETGWVFGSYWRISARDESVLGKKGARPAARRLEEEPFPVSTVREARVSVYVPGAVKYDVLPGG